MNVPVALFTLAVVLADCAPHERHADASRRRRAVWSRRWTARAIDRGRRTMRARSALLVAADWPGRRAARRGRARRPELHRPAAGRSRLLARPCAHGHRPAARRDVPPNRWLNDFLERVRALPGVEAAGAVYLRPLMLGPIGQGVRVFLEGQPETRQAADANPTLNHQIATPGYFEAMRIPLRRGRLFTERDTADVPRVAIVSESDRTPVLAGPGSARQEDLRWRPSRPAGRRARGGRSSASCAMCAIAASTRCSSTSTIRRCRSAGRRTTSSSGPRAIRWPSRRLSRAGPRDGPAVIVDGVTSMDAVVGARRRRGG